MRTVGSCWARFVAPGESEGAAIASAGRRAIARRMVSRGSKPALSILLQSPSDFTVFIVYQSLSTRGR